MPDFPLLHSTFDVAREFPITKKWTFLNHAAVSPIAWRAAAAIVRYAREAAEDAYLTGRWYKKAEVVRQRAARLINAAPEEVAFVKNTSEGIAFVANGLSWQAGDEIISTAVEYPAMVYPWMDLAQRFGVQHIMVPERTDGGVGRFETADILGRVTSRTRMIALSHVEFASGFRHDLAAIGGFCRQRGILFCVDAIQSCGVLPVDVQAMNIDFLSADGHKWLIGPEGAGFFFCRRELIPQVHPEIGWMNVAKPEDFSRYDFTLPDTAKRFECGSYNIPGVLGLGESLGLLLEVGIETISSRVLALTTILAEGLEKKGYRVYSSRREGEASGIVSFSPASGDAGLDAIARELQQQKIIVAVRGGRLRASPHFYNTPEQIDRLVAALP